MQIKMPTSMSVAADFPQAAHDISIKIFDDILVPRSFV